MKENIFLHITDTNMASFCPVLHYTYCSKKICKEPSKVQLLIQKMKYLLTTSKLSTTFHFNLPLKNSNKSIQKWSNIAQYFHIISHSLSPFLHYLHPRINIPFYNHKRHNYFWICTNAHTAAESLWGITQSTAWSCISTKCRCDQNSLLQVGVFNLVSTQKVS